MEEQLEAGERFFSAGKFDDAKQCFRAFLDRYPENPEALNNLGVVCHALEDCHNAEKYFVQAIAAKNDYTDALANLSNLYMNSNRWEPAARCLDQLISRGVAEPGIYKQLAVCYLEMGQKEKADAIAGQCAPKTAVAQGPDDAIRHAAGPSGVSGGVEGPRKDRTPISLSKKLLFDILKMACYFPHPEAHVGQLNLSKDIFRNRDRETNVVISPRARIDLTGNVSIGPWTMIGEGTQILTHDHFHEGRGLPLLLVQEEKGIRRQDKIIGRDVWLHDCRILYQVTEIPDGVVVGAGAVLTKNPGPYEIWAGNPAQKIGER